MTVFHIGRSWVGTELEDGCPCKKAPCGLVSTDGVDPSCTQHPMYRAKTMRQMYFAESCPRCEALGLIASDEGS